MLYINKKESGVDDELDHNLKAAHCYKFPDGHLAGSLDVQWVTIMFPEADKASCVALIRRRNVPLQRQREVFTASVLQVYLKGYVVYYFNLIVSDPPLVFMLQRALGSLPLRSL